MTITEPILDNDHPYIRETLKVKLDGYEIVQVRAADPVDGWCDILLTVPTKEGKSAPEIPIYFIGRMEPDGRRGAVTARVYGKVEITGELKEP